MDVLSYIVTSEKRDSRKKQANQGRGRKRNNINSHNDGMF